MFAIPGSIHNPMSKGCHRLIRDGATLVETTRDILEELAPRFTPPGLPMPPTAEQPDDLSDNSARHLLACLAFDPLPVDALVEKSGLTTEAVSSMLVIMELQGLVSSSGGRYFRLKGSA